MKNRVIACFLVLLGCLSCRPEPTHVTRINKENFTLAEQQKIGDILHETIQNNQEKFPILSRLDFPEAYNYLNLLIKTLLASPHVENRNNYNWDITIIRDDNIKTAFITPGGHLYVYTGLLKLLDTEHQLAAIMAHEIAYADLGLIIDRLKAEYGGIVLGDFLLENMVGNLEEIACSLVNLAFSGSDVLSADSYSVDLLCPFAYDASGIKSFLQTVDSSDILVEWLEYRRGDFEERIQNITMHAVSCGTQGEVFKERYRNFKHELIP